MHNRFSELKREYDLVIVGGGIIGAGIARDAALRGLSVALFERSDFGGGTTSGSTRLIHGGLRYLEMLDFGLVRMDLREREILLRIAPHLVKPLLFTVPFYDRGLFYRAKFRAGMALYDLLSFDKSLPNHRFLTSDEASRADPSLESAGLQGAACYYDAQVNSPERLCLENILDAREHGATAFPHAEVTGALSTGGVVSGVRVRDLLDGSESDIRARVVVNASGPWLDRIAPTLARHPRALIRTTKGIHIACAPVSANATVLFSNADGRLFFVIPWQGYSWVGTTDTDFSGDPRSVQATGEEVDYLIRSAGRFLPQLRSSKIYWSNAGVRALVRKPGHESSVTRLHRIVETAPGLLSVLGGKITGFRAIAEDATDRVCRSLKNVAPCRTAEIPLPGARALSAPGLSCSAELAAHLQGIYGGRAARVLELADEDPRLYEPLGAECRDIAAQVAFAVRNEACYRLSDFILRRTLLGFGHDQGTAAASAVASIMAAELGWTANRQASELREFRAWVEGTQAFRSEQRLLAAP